jgi:hypothetical protein
MPGENARLDIVHMVTCQPFMVMTKEPFNARDRRPAAMSVFSAGCGCGRHRQADTLCGSRSMETDGFLDLINALMTDVPGPCSLINIFTGDASGL